ncbi:MAG: DUF4911 domain-containing protein [Desulfovermiculus sp.]
MTMTCPASQPCTWSQSLYLRIPRQEIAFFKFMLECEHNLALMTVVDKFEAAVKLSFAPGQDQEVESFLDRMQEEMILERLPLPRTQRQPALGGGQSA